MLEMVCIATAEQEARCKVSRNSRDQWWGSTRPYQSSIGGRVTGLVPFSIL